MKPAMLRRWFAMMSDVTVAEALRVAGDGTEYRMVDHALGYAARGWHVFPLHSVVGNHCSCRNPKCTVEDGGSPAKHPRTLRGLLNATTNQEQIRLWWGRWPDANIGVRTGQISGIVVLDVDTDKGGLETWTKLQEINGRVEALTSHTGGGGVHLFFKAPEGVVLKSTAGIIGPGVDTRAEGGYVVAPPSVHISGRRYEWDGEAVIETGPQLMPAWLLARYPKRTQTHNNGHRHSEPVGADIPEGQRDATLTRIAGAMRQRGMTAEEMVPSLMAVNSRRCYPPLTKEQVRKIAWSVERYEPGCRRNVDRVTVRVY